MIKMLIMPQIIYQFWLISNSQEGLLAGAKRKIHWSNFCQGTINVKYVTPLLVDSTDFGLSESNDTRTVTKTKANLLLQHSYSLFSPGSNCNRKRKHGVGNKINFLTIALRMTTISQNVKIIIWL